MSPVAWPPLTAEFAPVVPDSHQMTSLQVVQDTVESQPLIRLIRREVWVSGCLPPVEAFQ